MSKLKTLGKRGLSLLLSFLMLFSLLPVTAFAAVASTVKVTPNNIQWDPATGNVTGTVEVDVSSEGSIGNNTSGLTMTIGAVSTLETNDGSALSDLNFAIESNDGWGPSQADPSGYTLPFFMHKYSGGANTVKTQNGKITIDLGALNFKITKSAVQTALTTGEYSEYFDSTTTAVNYVIFVSFSAVARNYCTGFTVNLADAPKYTVTYDANRGTVTPASAQVEQGKSVTLPTPTRSGYYCTGWYTASSGGTKVGDPGANYTPTGDVTLYAQWKPLAVLTATPSTVGVGANGTVGIQLKNTVDGSTAIIKSVAWKDGNAQNGTTITATADNGLAISSTNVVTLNGGGTYGTTDSSSPIKTVTTSGVTPTNTMKTIVVTYDNGNGEDSTLEIPFIANNAQGHIFFFDKTVVLPSSASGNGITIGVSPVPGPLRLTELTFSDSSGIEVVVATLGPRALTAPMSNAATYDLELSESTYFNFTGTPLNNLIAQSTSDVEGIKDSFTIIPKNPNKACSETITLTYKTGPSQSITKTTSMVVTYEPAVHVAEKLPTPVGTTINTTADRNTGKINITNLSSFPEDTKFTLYSDPTCTTKVSGPTTGSSFTGLDAGTYYVQATHDNTDDYLPSDAGVFTVGKDKIAVQLNTNSGSRTYNGSATDLSGLVSVKEVSGGAAVPSGKYTITYSKGSSATDAGTYTATVTLTDTDNYAFGNGKSNVYTYTINKATPTVTVTPAGGQVGDSHSPTVTVTGVGGTNLTAGTDYILGGWQNAGGSAVTLNASTPQGTYTNAVAMSGDAATNYNNPSAATYAIGAQIHYTPTVTVLVDGAAPTSGDIVSVGLGDASTASVTKTSGTGGVYTFDSTLIGITYTHVHVTIHNDHKNGTASTVYALSQTVGPSTKDVTVNLYTVRVTSAALDAGLSAATAGGKTSSSYVIVPAGTSVPLAVTVATGYRKDAWTVAGSGNVSGDTFTSAPGAATLTPHATALSQIQLLEGGTQKTSLSLSVTEGYADTKILTAGTATSGGWVKNAWPRPVGKLTAVINDSVSSHTATATSGSAASQLTVTLGSGTTNVAQNSGTGITINVPAGLTRGSYTAYLWLYDDGADTALCAPVRIPITINVATPEYIVSNTGNDSGVNSVTAKYTSTNGAYTLGTSKVSDGQTITATAAMKANYAFGGWAITAGTGTFSAPNSTTTVFAPTSDATIKARAIAQPNVSLATGTTIASTTQWNTVTTSTNVYSSTLSNSGAAAATKVTYTLEDVGGGSTVSSKFDLAIADITSGTGTLATSASKAVTIKPNTTLAAGNYSFNLKITYERDVLDTDKTDGSTKKETVTITRPISFSLAAASYTVTLKVDPSGSGTATAKLNGSNFTSGGSVTENNVLAITATPNSGYEFVNWTITSPASGATSSFADATNRQTTFIPKENATIQANMRAIAILVLSNESKNNSADLTGLSTSTNAYSGKLANSGALAATPTYKVQMWDGSAYVDTNLFTVSGPATLAAGATGTAGNLTIKPKDAAAVTAIQTAGPKTYQLRLTVDYDKYSGTAAPQIVSDNIYFTVGKGYFNAEVEVKLDGSPANNATVTMKPSDTAKTATTNSSGIASFTGTTLKTNTNYTLSVTVSGKTVTIGTVNRNADATGDDKIQVELYTVAATAVGASPTISGTGIYKKGDNVTVSTTLPSGYDFEGWTGTDISSAVTTASYTVSNLSKRVDLTATFKPYYNLAYDVNSAAAAAPTGGKYYADDMFTVANDITWSGRTFDGWYTAATGGTKVTADGTQSFKTVFSSATPGSTTTLYAHWTASGVTYTPATALTGTYGVPFSADLGIAQSSDTGDDTYITYTATGVPAGLTMNAAGLLFGTPREAKTSKIMVTATDSRNNQSASLEWTLTVGKYIPSFIKASISPMADNTAVNKATLYGTVTGPFWDGTQWVDGGEEDDVMKTPTTKVRGIGNLSVVESTPFTPAAQLYTLKYTPAGKYANVWDETSTQLKVSSLGSVVGPNLIITPARHTFTSGSDVQTFTIINNGSESAGTVSFTLGDKFEFTSGGSNVTLDAGQTTTVSVKPKAATAATIGTHIGELKATSDTGKTASAFLDFTVAAPTTYAVTVNLKHVDTAGTATAADANTPATGVVMRPVSGTGDKTGARTATGTYVWDTTKSNALTYGTIYQIMVDGQPSGQYVTKDNDGQTVTVNRYQLALAQNPAAGATLTGAGYLLRGQSATVSATAAPTGYRFAKWTEGSTDKSTAAAFTYIMPSDATQGVTLTANYTKVYGVTFDANGGTMTGTKQLANGPTFAVGETISINAPAADKYTISKTGYTFKGWATTSTATSGSYTATMATPTSGDTMTLYAVWGAADLSAAGGEVKGTYGTALTSVTVGTPTGGSGSYSYAITSGALPGGVTFSGGTFSGTPTAATASPVTVTVEITDDGTGAKTNVDYKIDIAKRDPVVNPAPQNVTGAQVGTPYDATAISTGAKATGITADNTAAGGTLPGTWSIEPTSVTATDGTQTVKVKFTPTDTNNYNNWEGTVTVAGAYKKITGLTLGGITTPAAGAAPVDKTSATVTAVTGATGVSDDKVTVTDLKWSPAVSGNFLSGTDYTAIVTMTPATGWQFDTTAITTGVKKATGMDGTLTVLSATGDRLVCQVYYAVPKTISEVAVTTTSPAKDGTDTTVTTANGTYSVESYEWKEKVSSTKVDATHPFEANKTYILTVKLKPLAGYTFDLNPTTGVKKADHAKVNNTNATQVTPGSWTDTSVTISYEFGPIPESALFGITATGALKTPAYYAKTDTHTANTVTGHKSGVGFQWDPTCNPAVKITFVYADATTSDAPNGTSYVLVYGDTAADAKGKTIPAGYNFTDAGTSDDVAKYNGKKVYVQYTDSASNVYVAPDPVGTLVVRELEATSITPSSYNVKLNYIKGDKFTMPSPALTATVGFNAGVTGLANSAANVPLKSGSNEGYIFAVSDGAGGYTKVDGSTTVDSLNGEDLYMVFTDVNNNTVAARLGTLRVAGDTEIAVAIHKGGNPVNDTTNPAEYGDTLTANVTGTVSGTLSYQWQVNNSGTWSNVTGETAPSYVPKKTDVGKQVRVVVTEAGKAGNATSDPVTIQKRTVTFDVKSYDKNYDGTADNKHTSYAGADFTLSNVVSGDTLTLTYTGAVPGYSGAEVGKIITWPAVTAATQGDYTLSDGAYRLGTQSALSNKGTITSKEIGTIKVTAPQPVAGSNLGDPSKTVTDDPYSLGTRTWTPNDTPAGNSKAYQISVPVTSATGYTFSDGVKAEVTVGGTVYVGTVTKTADNKATVTFTFPATAAPAEDTPVQHVDVHFAKSPAHDDAIPTVPTGYSEQTQIDLVNQGSGVTAKWYESGTAVTGKFDANKTYTVEVKVKSKSGFAFDNNTKFYFHFGAGETVAVTPTSDDNGVYTMSHTFPAVERIKIAHVNVSVPQPVVYGTPANGTTNQVLGTNSSNQLTNVNMSDITWYDAATEGNVITSPTKFQAGGTYRAEFDLTTQNSYEYANNVTFTVSGVGPITGAGSKGNATTPANTVITSVTTTTTDADNQYHVVVLYKAIEGGKVDLTDVVVNASSATKAGVEKTGPEVDNTKPYELTGGAAGNKWEYWTGSAWAAASNGTGLSADGKFLPGNDYRVTAKVQLTDTAHYQITGDTKFYLAGLECGTDAVTALHGGTYKPRTESSGVYTLIQEFSIPNNEISLITVTYKEPVAGQNAATKPDSYSLQAQVTIADTGDTAWFTKGTTAPASAADFTGSALGSAAFADGTYYMVTATIHPNTTDGYTFVTGNADSVGNTQVNINGVLVNVDGPMGTKTDAEGIVIGWAKATYDSGSKVIKASYIAKTAAVDRVIVEVTTNVTAPVAGATPAGTTSTATALNGEGRDVKSQGMTNSGDVAITWTPSAAEFGMATAYTAKFTLKTKDQYTFKDSTDNAERVVFSVNGVKVTGAGTTTSNGITVTTEKKSATEYAVTVTFPETSDKTPITAVSVTYAEPVIGGNPAASVSYTPTAQVRLGTEVDGNLLVTNRTAGTTWFKDEKTIGACTGTGMGSTATFAPGKYTVYANFTALGSTKFDSDTTFTVNGTTYAGNDSNHVTIAANGTTAQVCHTFTVSGTIVRVVANVTQPVAGEAMNRDVSRILAQTNEGADVTTSGLKTTFTRWEVSDNGTDGWTTASGNFQAGKYYRAIFTASAESGYKFLANGGSVVTLADGDNNVDFLVNSVGWINGAEDGTQNSITVKTAQDGGTDKYTITVTFPMTGATADILTVWGNAKEPVAGGTVNAANDIKVPTTEPYKIVTGGVKWYEGNVVANAGGATEAGGTFQAGQTYTAEMTVELKDNYKGIYQLTNTTKGHINDTAGTTNVSYDGDNGTVTLRRAFTVPAAATDLVVYGNVVVPTAGNAARPTNITAITGQPYEKASAQWLDDEGNPFTGNFAPGKTYTAELTVRVKDANTHSFIAGTRGYLNNELVSAADKELNDDGTLTLRKSFTLEDSSITPVTVNSAQPTPGSELPTSINPGDSSKYTFESASWGPADESVEYSKTYTLTVTVAPEEGINLPGTNTSGYTWNGRRASSAVDAGDGKYTVTFEYTTPAQPTPPPAGTTIINREVPVVSYWLGKQGATDDMTVEKVSEGGKPKNVPEVTWIEEGYAFVGWTDTPYEDGQKPTLVDPTTVTIRSDTVFYAVYEKRATTKHEHYVKGYENGFFLPLGDITRAEVATIIARSCLRGYVEGANYGNAGLTDIDDHWARSAIAFCALSGILNGYNDGTFQPNEPITRQEFAVAMSKMAGVQKSQGLTFKDADKVADWAEDAVYTCVTNGWVSGYTDGKFSPTTNLLRAEAVKIMNGYLKRKVDPKSLPEILDLLKIFPDVPQNYWAYYEILEAANDHDFFLTGEDGKSLPEYWTNAYVGDVSWGS